MEDEIEKGNKLKITPPKTSDPPPSPKSGRKYGSAGIHGMSWEEFFEREEERRERLKNFNERGIRNGTMVKLYQKIFKYWKTIREAWKLDEGRPRFEKTRKLYWSLCGIEAGRLRGME